MTTPLLAAFDVETTGLSSAYGDRICEVGLALARDGQIIDTYQALVNPGRLLSPGAARVNGLTDGMLRGAPPFAAVAPELLERLEGAVLVCHNAPFDLGFLQSELARLGLSYNPPAVLDTLNLARRYFSFPSNSLSKIAAVLGIGTPQAHRALGDALTTLQVLQRFLAQLDRAESGLADGLLPEWAGFSNAALPEAGAMEAAWARISLHPGAARPPSAYEADPDLALPPAIQEALSANLPLEIVYVDAKGAETLRRVTPRSVRGANDYIYLVAFCHLRQAERSFRLDRIVEIRR